jgi:hypothetical protein
MPAGASPRLVQLRSTSGCEFSEDGSEERKPGFRLGSLGAFRAWRVDPFTYRGYELLVERKSCPFRRHLTER